MTAAYATFSNLGYKVKPHMITKVEDIEGVTAVNLNLVFEPE